MTKAFVFPGQGSQAVGMGRELMESFPEARAVFQEVDDALGEKLSDVIFEGPVEALTLTHNTQPALMAVSVAVVRVIEKLSGKPLAAHCAFVAGHSLGEYSALCAAGAISLKETAQLLRTRGNAMQAAVPAGKGGMAALIGVDFAQAEALAKEASKEGPCQAANDNGGGQVVISGAMAAIDKAIELAPSMGIKRAVKLPVSAPFHSSMMQPAAHVMEKALAGAKVISPSVPLIANVTADVVTDPARIAALLVEQVTGAVRWRESVEQMKALGVTQLVECGSGKVLAGLAKRIDKELESVSLLLPADIENFLNALAA